MVDAHDREVDISPTGNTDKDGERPTSLVYTHSSDSCLDCAYIKVILGAGSGDDFILGAGYGKVREYFVYRDDHGPIAS